MWTRWVRRERMQSLMNCVQLTRERMMKYLFNVTWADGVEDSIVVSARSEAAALRGLDAAIHSEWEDSSGIACTVVLVDVHLADE